MSSIAIIAKEIAVIGQASTLACRVNTSFLLPVSLLSVQWIHNDVAIITQSVWFALQPTQYETKLAIPAITLDHTGEYTCIVTIGDKRQQLAVKRQLMTKCEAVKPF